MNLAGDVSAGDGDVANSRDVTCLHDHSEWWFVGVGVGRLRRRHRRSASMSSRCWWWVDHDHGHAHTITIEIEVESMSATRQVAAPKVRGRTRMISSLALLSLLSMQSSSSLFRHVSSFPLLSPSASSSWRKTLIASRPRVRCIPLSSNKYLSRNEQTYISSRLFSQSSESVVELQYSEFIPPSTESTHPPVM